MNLDDDIFVQFRRIRWFQRCGDTQSLDYSFAAKQVAGLADALSMVQSEDWFDARTQAQGELTGHLARNHLNQYGGHWNRMAKTAQQRVGDEVMPAVNESLTELRANGASDAVALDLCRIAVQAAYRKRFRRIPEFFAHLFEVYQSGHLPCGWEGDLDRWPQGRLVIY